MSQLDLTILVLNWRAFKNIDRCWAAGGDPTAMIAPQIAAYEKPLRPMGIVRIEPGDHEKMSMKGKPRGLLLAAALCASVPAGAATLTIINPSFELPAVTIGGLQTGATGWDILGPNTDSGVWNIEDSPLGFWNTPVPGLDGNQVAYLASGFSPAGGGLAQTLSCSTCFLDPSFLYTLTGVVGVPQLESSPTPLPNYSISLWAGTNQLGFISDVGPARTLAPFTLVVDGSDFSRFTGQQLRIELFSDGPQTAIDALVLQATAAVPEPTSVALFAVGIGLLALSLRVRDKRRMAAT